MQTTTAPVDRVTAPRPSPLPAVAGLLALGVVIAGAGVSASLTGRPAAAEFMTDSWPFVVVGLSMVVVVLLISVVRLHACLALLLSAWGAGFMTAGGTLPGEPGLSHALAAVEFTAQEFGTLASKVGIVIALASVIGACLLESGAADKVVRRFLALFGEKHAGLALLLATYVVSIPIFFETIFMLLAPLAQSLRRRTGKDYVLYLLAICCAAAATHGMIIPHPGPAALAGELGFDAGMTILVGLSTGLLPLAAGWLFALVVNRRLAHVTPPALGPDEAPPEVESEAQLPPLGLALLPILLPVGLIAAASVAGAWGACPPMVRAVALFAGNRYMALLLGAVAGTAVLMRQRGLSLTQVSQRFGAPLEMAAIVILIICAGGSFGAVLKAAGIREAITAAATGHQLNLIVLGYVVAALLRVAQGSATVAMIATGSLVHPLIGAGLPYHPVYIFMAISYGALFGSWMNDGGFWVISRLGGLSERQTLGSWSLLTVVMSLTGGAMSYGLSMLVPAVGH